MSAPTHAEIAASHGPEVPTVEAYLASTATSNGFHEIVVDGGAITITITTEELRPLLEAAYDPTMPDWPSLADL